MMKINVGCGKRNFGKDWVHVDGGKFSHLDHHSILLGPHPNGTVDLIYSSHLIAYFSRTEIVPILKSWFDVLKPGGVLQVATPDFTELADIVLGLDDPLYFGIPIENILGPLYGEMEMNGVKIYHKTVYDFASLSTLLQSVGFTEVKLYDHRTTCHPNTGDRKDFYDDHSSAYINGQLISLNVQCVKP